MQPIRTDVLFIHGGGDDGYEADAKLAASLRAELGATYHVRYPRMPDAPAPDFGWGAKIATEIGALNGKLFLVGHSLGASMLLKYLSEHDVEQPIAGLFLIATPFWSGDEDWVQGLMLPASFPETLPKGVPIFFYYAEDDEEIDITHLDRRSRPGTLRLSRSPRWPSQVPLLRPRHGHRLGST